MEDDTIYAENIELLLNNTDDIFCMKTFCSTKDFLSEFKNHAPDIYWIDINLVDRSGSDMIYNIKQHTPPIP